jgi:hypothetical protein
MTTANAFRDKRIIAAALCTAPFALGSVLGSAGVAYAKPSHEWDIGAYDACLQRVKAQEGWISPDKQ